MSDFLNLERLMSAFRQIRPYIGLTFQFWIVCIIGITIVALILAAIRVKNIPIVQQITSVYISFMRGTPLLIQIFIVYWGLPLFAKAIFKIDISRWDALIFAEIGVILNESAFLSEDVRAAILAVPHVQKEAAYSIGMTDFMTFIRIILPQAIRILIPSYGTRVLVTFQESSILYLVGVTDMVSRAKGIAKITGHTIEAFLSVALIYIIFNLILKGIMNIIEKRMRYGRRC